MPDDVLRLRLDVGLDEHADAAELEGATLQLRDELLNLDVERVERAGAGPPPEGARAAEVAVLGTLLVEVGRATIEGVIRAIGAWVARHRERTVKLTLGQNSIELSNLSDADQRRLTDAFLASIALPRGGSES